MSPFLKEKPLNPATCPVLAIDSVRWSGSPSSSMHSPNSRSTPLFPPYRLPSVLRNLECPRVAISQSHSEPSYAGPASQFHAPKSSCSKNQGRKGISKKPKGDSQLAGRCTPLFLSLSHSLFRWLLWMWHPSMTGEKKPRQLVGQRSRFETRSYNHRCTR